MAIARVRAPAAPARFLMIWFMPQQRPKQNLFKPLGTS
jgi:hypothetical protein